MFRHVYSFLFYLALPGVWFRVLLRSIKEPEYRHDPLQRFGAVPASAFNEPEVPDNPLHRSGSNNTPGEVSQGVRGKPVLWVHAVSAGETNAVAPLISRLLDRGYSIVVTNMTPAGRDRTRTLLGNRVDNYYVPYDLPGSVKRFLRRVKPDVLIVVDTELWPNMLHYSRVAGVRILLANARLSEKSARGYSRIRTISEEMLQDVTRVAAQTEAQGCRFLELGLSENKLHIAGSIKFDNTLPPHLEVRTEAAKQILGPGRVLIAASTHPGEEQAILSILGELKKSLMDLRLVIAPRHTHRAKEVADLCIAAGYPVIRRTTGQSCTHQDQVFLLDTMGELASFYATADVAFVGGSLVPVGGHNFIEAVMADTPVIMGPHLDSIDDIAAQFLEAKAMVVVNNKQELSAELHKMFASKASRRRLADNAAEVCSRNRGALEQIEELVVELVNVRV